MKNELVCDRWRRQKRMICIRPATGLSVLGSAFLKTKGVVMDVILAAVRLLEGLFGAMKALLELKGLRRSENDHSDARKHRPKHLRG